MTWVFVYGTLRSGGAASQLLDGGVSERHAAWLEDHALVGGEYPFVVPQPGSWTRGDLVRLDPVVADETLIALDRYEGDEYRRELVDVRVDGRVVTAHVWVAARPETVAGRPPILSGDWLAPPCDNAI